MQRKLNTVIAILSLSLLMVQFQNCAGPNNMTSTQPDGTVHLINDVTKSGVQFPVNNLHLSEQASNVNLGGICDRSHDGQSFDWSVSVSGSDLAKGSGSCEHGQFRINFANASNLVCGVPYQVQVSASWGGTAGMTIDKLCEPLASGDLANPPPSYGQPQSCQLEYRVSVDGFEQGLCQAVCFRNDILSHQEDRPLSECESLIVQVSRR